MDVSNNFPFVRDRIVECYFCWVFAVSYEPEFSLARITSCKVIAMVSIIDDIYDNHGTYEELVLFTEAIQRLIFYSSIDLTSLIAFWVR